MCGQPCQGLANQAAAGAASSCSWSTAAAAAKHSTRRPCSTLNLWPPHRPCPEPSRLPRHRAGRPDWASSHARGARAAATPCLRRQHSEMHICACAAETRERGPAAGCDRNGARRRPCERAAGTRQAGSPHGREIVASPPRLSRSAAAAGANNSRAVRRGGPDRARAGRRRGIPVSALGGPGAAGDCAAGSLPRSLSGMLPRARVMVVIIMTCCNKNSSNDNSSISSSSSSSSSNNNNNNNNNN